MKNIETILSDFGITIPEGKAADLRKAVAENYKTVAEFTKLQERHDALDTSLKDVQGKLAAFDGVVIFYTHGHMYGVKYDLDTLADAAAARGAEVALFGHTHKPIALQKNGVFLFNPGSCGRCYTGPNTYGVMLLDKGRITSFAHKEVPQQ